MRSQLSTVDCSSWVNDGYTQSYCTCICDAEAPRWENAQFNTQYQIIAAQTTRFKTLTISRKSASPIITLFITGHSVWRVIFILPLFISLDIYILLGYNRQTI